MEEKKNITYKGFDENLCCRGFQYEIGKEYEQTGDIKICQNGFHACKNPLDVLQYYVVDGQNRFCEVEQSGIIDSKFGIDTNQASSKIKIKKEIGLDGLCKAAIKWLEEKTILGSTVKKTNGKNITDDCSDHPHIYINKSLARINVSGFSAKIFSSGDLSLMFLSGHEAEIASSGELAEIVFCGVRTKVVSSGIRAHISSEGIYSFVGSIGDDAIINSTGGCAKIYSYGNFAKINVSGQYTTVVSEGNNACINSNGMNNKICSSGKNAIICCTGAHSVVKAKIGSWITFVECVYCSEKQTYFPVCSKTVCVDGEHIKEDTWYTLVNGEFYGVNSVLIM